MFLREGKTHCRSLMSVLKNNVLKENFHNPKKQKKNFRIISGVAAAAAALFRLIICL